MLLIFLDLLVFELATDQTFEGEDGIGRVDHGLTLSGQSNETFTMFCKGDDGRCCPCTLGILNYSRSLALHHGHARICCPQVNANNRACPDSLERGLNES
jgi:hypothetical protein